MAYDYDNDNEMHKPWFNDKGTHELWKFIKKINK